MPSGVSTRRTEPLSSSGRERFWRRWVQVAENNWRLEWTEESVRDFYLNNILIHELGHLVDTRNSSYADRERYAEWFALEYGYKPSRPSRPARKVVRRHHAGNRVR